MSQKSVILKHLKTGKSISPLKALGLYGCYRLASRVNDLRKDGHNIETMIQADGTGRNYAQYRLVA
tara:strand:+ start:819 stop:1016 length:198 start_codon:yes stop_codon:yes gene_type:complete